MSYRLMIIDDTSTNVGTYQNVLSNRDIFKEPTIVIDYDRNFRETIKNTYVDGYLIDLVLDQGSWERHRIGDAANLLNKHFVDIPRPAPIFIVSRTWGDDFKRAMGIVSNMEAWAVNVVDYMTWRDFKKAESDAQVKGELEARLKNRLDDWHGASSLSKKSDDDPIRILLLADPQFTDKNTRDEAAEGKIQTALDRDHRKPDLIALAGDISYSGIPCQFVYAKERIEFLRSGLKVLGDNIVLVPGNHDVNMLFSAVGDYDYDFQDWQIKKKDDCAKKRCTAPKCQSYALAPFRDFAFQLTGDRNWQRQENCSWVDKRFLHLGIRFLLLNTTEMISAREPGKIWIPQTSADRLDFDLRGGDAETFTIALSHHGLRPHTGQAGEKPIENLNCVEGLFGAGHVNLWCYGHYHSFEYYPHLPRMPNVCALQLPTYRLDTRSEDHRRGFVFLELQRKKGKVYGGQAFLYTLDHNGDWRPASSSYLV